MATFLQFREIRLDKEKVAIGLIILIISLWMFHKKVLPEQYSPGFVAFTRYVPLFIFFYVMSLVPFSDSECEHFSYALLMTVPQQFLIGVLEKYYHWHGSVQLVMNNVPIVDIFVGSYQPNLPVSATLYNPNIFSIYLVIAFTVSLGLLLREIRDIKTYDKAVSWRWGRIIFSGACLFFSAVVLLFFRSRHAMVAVILMDSLGLLLREIRDIKTYDKAVSWRWGRIIFSGACLFFSAVVLLFFRSRHAMVAVILMDSLGLLLREIRDIKTYDKAVSWRWGRIIFSGACLFFSLLLILFAGSRNAMVAVILTALFCSVPYKRTMALLKAVACCIIVLLLITSFNWGELAIFVRNDISPSVTRFWDSGHRYFLRGRAETYSCAMQLVRERPLTGWGLGMVREECAQRLYGAYGTHAHDIFLQLAAEIGVPFTMMITCLFSYVLIVSLHRFARKAVYWKLQDFDSILLTSVSAVLLMQIFDIALLMTYRLNFLFWLCFAIAYSRAIPQKQTDSGC